MELVEASHTISDKDRRFFMYILYIYKIETLRGKNPTEIHSALSDPLMTLE